WSSSLSLHDALPISIIVAVVNRLLGATDGLLSRRGSRSDRRVVHHLDRLLLTARRAQAGGHHGDVQFVTQLRIHHGAHLDGGMRSEEHTSELQSREK